MTTEVTDRTCKNCKHQGSLECGAPLPFWVERYLESMASHFVSDDPYCGISFDRELFMDPKEKCECFALKGDGDAE